jgi:chromosome segregation ATPase
MNKVLEDNKVIIDQLTVANNENKQLKQQNADLQNQLRNVKSNLTDLKTTFEQQKEELSLAKNNLAVNINELKNQINKEQDEFKKLNKRIIGTLRGKKSNLLNLNDNLLQQNQKLSDDVKKLEDQIQNYIMNENDNLKKLQDLQMEYNKFKSELANQMYKQLSNQIGTTANSVYVLRKNLITRRNRNRNVPIDSSESDTDTDSKELDNSSNTNSSQSNLILGVADNSIELQKQLNDLNIRYNELATLFNQLQTENQQLQNNLTDYNNADNIIQDYKNQITVLGQNIEQLKQEHKEKEDKIQKDNKENIDAINKDYSKDYKTLENNFNTLKQAKDAQENVLKTQIDKLQSAFDTYKLEKSQEIKKIHDDYVKQLQQKEMELNKNTEQINMLDDRIEELKKTIKFQNNKLEKLKQNLDGARNSDEVKTQLLNTAKVYLEAAGKDKNELKESNNTDTEEYNDIIKCGINITLNKYKKNIEFFVYDGSTDNTLNDNITTITKLVTKYKLNKLENDLFNTEKSLTIYTNVRSQIINIYNDMNKFADNVKQGNNAGDILFMLNIYNILINNVNNDVNLITELNNILVSSFIDGSDGSVDKDLYGKKIYGFFEKNNNQINTAEISAVFNAPIDKNNSDVKGGDEDDEVEGYKAEGYKTEGYKTEGYKTEVKNQQLSYGIVGIVFYYGLYIIVIFAVLLLIFYIYNSYIVIKPDQYVDYYSTEEYYNTI